MPIDFIQKLLEPTRAPVTYLLVALNLIVFISLAPRLMGFQAQVQKLVVDENYLQTQGQMFAQMIQKENSLFSPTLQRLAERGIQQDSEAIINLGFLAFQNTEFMVSADVYPFSGDAVAMVKWKDKFAQLRKLQKEDPSYHWGLSIGRHPTSNYITYQFAHGSFMHLIFNLMWLLIFGAMIEWVMGSSALILTYFIGGIGGAMFYNWMPGFSTSPLIGASGSISALIGYVVVMNQRRPYKFGAVPGWLLFIIFPLSDLSGWLGSLPELGSVAFSAHIGGALIGAFMGWLSVFNVVGVDEPLLDGGEATS